MTETTKKKTAKKAAKISRKGSDLAPDLTAHAPYIGREYAYWIGTLPGAPSESIDLGGVDFPKMTELVTGRGQDTRRIPRIGAIKRLNEDQVRRINEAIPRNVIRFAGPPEPPKMWNAETREWETGEYNGSLADLEFARRKGRLVRIPTAEQIEANRESRQPRPTYIKGRYDENAACYMFAQLCPDQKNPTVGSHYPEPLSKTGMPWPEDDPGE